jgi:hypothetical protein
MKYQNMTICRSIGLKEILFLVHNLSNLLYLPTQYMPNSTTDKQTLYTVECGPL